MGGAGGGTYISRGHQSQVALDLDLDVARAQFVLKSVEPAVCACVWGASRWCSRCRLLHKFINKWKPQHLPQSGYRVGIC